MKKIKKILIIIPVKTLPFVLIGMMYTSKILTDIIKLIFEIISFLIYPKENKTNFFQYMNNISMQFVLLGVLMALSFSPIPPNLREIILIIGVIILAYYFFANAVSFFVKALVRNQKNYQYNYQVFPKTFRIIATICKVPILITIIIYSLIILGVVAHITAAGYIKTLIESSDSIPQMLKCINDYDKTRDLKTVIPCLKTPNSPT